jgi:hypothetical protein
MLKELKSTLNRASATLWQDALGLGSLTVLLLIGLHLPGIV